jgi:surfeit locus 1 family protein
MPPTGSSGFPLRFRPKWWAAALAAAACAAGIALGNWQAGRAEQKRTAAATVELLSLRGDFDARRTVLLDNKLHRGRPGYHVVQPLRLQDGRHVLVDRGWIAAGPTRDALPEVRTPAGAVDISGVRLKRFPQAFAPEGARPEGRVWQNVTVEGFAAWSGLVLEPYVLEQHTGPEDGLVRERARPDAGIEKHQSYALQWYSLAALSIVLFVALNLKRGKAGS